MGGAKVREIGQTPILNWYAKVFEETLTAANSKLMIVGYGFRDEHINAAIARAVERGLRLFIIAPEGAELARRLNPTRARGHIVAPTPSSRK
jgi:phosphatidylserine/phosphatidylglycerophosphate/cardiolipin synthase-like enzyme